MKIRVGPRSWARIDEKDWDIVGPHLWRIYSSGKRRYARTTIGGKTVSMHRLILSAQPDQIVDHRDGDGLNNTRRNLRFCTNAENCRNQVGQPHKRKSKYKGVCKYPYSWHAQISVDGKKHHLGHYKTQEEAAAAYNEAALKYHGAFARLNLLTPEERS